MSQNGKGDKPRPISVPADEFARRWEKAIGPRPQPETPKVEKAA